tara:strand:+ start:4084 stop:6585 length:2502 start_codon:yes stop_codon:yes gene_type:complete
MQTTFLEAANGQRLSKRHCPHNGFTPYPHVKSVSSHEVEVPLDSSGLAMLEKLIRDHADRGHCLLKGNLKRPIQNESRAGKTDRVGYSNLLVLDIDGITLPGHTNPKTYDAIAVATLAKTVMRELPPAVQDCAFIAQASASLGLKGDKVSLHIFILLKHAMPAKAVKLWLQASNFESELFSSQLELSSNGHSLKYPLDISVADNSKLIFIAPPTFEDGTHDPFSSSSAERIVRVSGISETLDLAKLMNDISPEVVHQKSNEHKNKLRVLRGFNAKKERLTIANINNKSEEILTNPDRMSITVHDDSHGQFIHCNVNGGDSNAYYFKLDDPTYMFNFKGEPIWSIEQADPDFYKTLFDVYEKEMAKEGRANFPVALRDYYTDTYYNGVFDPNLNQFSEEFPLLPCASASIEGFMRSHGRSKPDFIPDARVVFDPASNDAAVNLTNVPYHINMFRKTEYMLSNREHEPLGMGDAARIADSCPLIYKLMTHILGGKNLELEYFTNWLAYIFQTKRKAMTAWVLQGVPGTGKGIFYTKVLRPLFGTEHVPMRALQNIEEQFNLYMRQALFLVVDEFHMASANSGTVKVADKLKNAITENTMTIRAMRSNQIEMPNYTNFIFLTNRMDAVKIEEGDRRYNIAPRQEQKLEHVYPEVVDGIDDIEKELHKFAALLKSFKVNKQLVRTPISNSAKAQMAQVTMSVMEEFFAAVRHGNLSFFMDILDIELTNVLQGAEITTAQRLVKQWVAESQWPHSVIPMEHMRTVYGVLTDDRISQREFQKKAERCGIVKERKRLHNALRNSTPVTGVITKWKLDSEQLTEVTDKYFDDKDRKLLAQA